MVNIVCASFPTSQKGLFIKPGVSWREVFLLENLKGLFHPAFLARVVSWFPFVVAIFMGHENGGKQRLAKRRHVHGMLDETDPLISRIRKI